MLSTFIIYFSACELPDQSLFQKGSGGLYEGGVPAEELDQEEAPPIGDTGIIDDTGTEDTGTIEDTGTEDTGEVEDTAFEDTGLVDTGSEDTGIIEDTGTTGDTGNTQ